MSEIKIEKINGGYRISHFQSTVANQTICPDYKALIKLLKKIFQEKK